jgi:multicomponent Na+:H+ antiporter subunit D
MILGTILWLTLPFFVGFGIALLPQGDRPSGWGFDHRLLALGVTLLSMAYAVMLFWQPLPFEVQLLDSFGVTLMVDRLSAFFILTNALVTAAVVLYCWPSDKTSFFYILVILLHSSVNAAFVCADLISLYVALEVISITAFLLIAYPNRDRSLWIAMRYLFVSNTAMLFYLMGTAMVYRTYQTFAFTGLRGAPYEALALIFLALLAKGGIFVSGLWLPLTHSEADSPVSALLSGVVVKAGVFPLVRFALMIEELGPMVQWLGVAAALLGVLYALTETDAKRVLACSTLSQLGWVLAVPEAAGLYVLAHGLGKAALFLIVGNLPSRNLSLLRRQPIDTALWMPLALGSLSISGMPLLAGFSAKVLTLKQALPEQSLVLNGAAVGTATLYAKFVFLPHQASEKPDRWTSKPGLWMAVTLLLGALLIVNLGYLDVYTGSTVAKTLLLIGAGFLIHQLLIQRVTLTLPQTMEKFEHLIGGMSLILVVLFWITWSWLG